MERLEHLGLSEEQQVQRIATLVVTGKVNAESFALFPDNKRGNNLLRGALCGLVGK